MEGHPSFYRRTEIELEGAARAEAYLLPARELRRAEVIVGGSWKERVRASRSRGALSEVEGGRATRLGRS